jgi:hypothetical protein
MTGPLLRLGMIKPRRVKIRQIVATIGGIGRPRGADPTHQMDGDDFPRRPLPCFDNPLRSQMMSSSTCDCLLRTGGASS